MTADEAYKMWELAHAMAQAEAVYEMSKLKEAYDVFHDSQEKLMAARKELADYINSFVKE